MRYRVLSFVLILASLSFVRLSANGQGLCWESKMTGGPLGERTSKYYYMPKKFKFAEDNGTEAFIFRLDKELLVVLYPGDKTYSEITFAELEKKMKELGGKMDKQLEDMRKQFAALPPDQRKVMEQMMGDKMRGLNSSGKFDVKRTGESKTIGGYACAKYSVRQDGKETVGLWTTKDVKDFELIRKDLEQFGQRMAAMTPNTGKGLAEAMKNLEGFPIQTEFMGMTSTVSKIEKRNTPGSEFEVPAGYTKVAPKMFQGMEGHEEEK